MLAAHDLSEDPSVKERALYFIMENQSDELCTARSDSGTDTGTSCVSGPAQGMIHGDVVPGYIVAYYMNSASRYVLISMQG